ncbi:MULTISPECIES: hypothetical protein [Gordonibacter]|uniref:Uncharacterized protein n=1 Tax=Gordonibacter faecis TaxID=3047475 RepID=A0ABT7DN22_9ACTN|nr:MULTISPECIES: hypothetical protein [unclassified Gordonibacter]MDJ1650797.1 hypothetical protein [Gordonibacter sp. KGMB12511]HIW77173.1 hypothetical protein [Candidatus Gordonibacter avicola]
MEANGWISFLLLLIFGLLLLTNGKVKRLARTVEAAFTGQANASSHRDPESMRRLIGQCVELEFSTHSRDTVRILDVDDYCILAECVYTSLGAPAGTRWVLPLKDIVAVKILA